MFKVDDPVCYDCQIGILLTACMYEYIGCVEAPEEP
jgi:hypothetical protein